jgi:hypothetical protein
VHLFTKPGNYCQICENRLTGNEEHILFDKEEAQTHVAGLEKAPCPSRTEINGNF